MGLVSIDDGIGNTLASRIFEAKVVFGCCLFRRKVGQTFFLSSIRKYFNRFNDV